MVTFPYILFCSMRSGGAHGRYGAGDWTFLKCRQHMATASDLLLFVPFIAYFMILAFRHEEIPCIKILREKNSMVGLV